MSDNESQHIVSLVEPGRVHRDVYVDPELFELEMERLFQRTWLLVCHESQLPQQGDFATAEEPTMLLSLVGRREPSDQRIEACVAAVVAGVRQERRKGHCA